METNETIKRKIKESRIFGYEIAGKIGVSETAFSKWFRKELTEEQKSRILAAIAEIKGE